MQQFDNQRIKKCSKLDWHVESTIFYIKVVEKKIVFVKKKKV